MKKILMITNHSYMLWQFRRELAQALLEDQEVVISTPFVGHEKDFEQLGCKMIETDVDRRGINPFTDFKLFWTYVKMLRQEKPNMVVTYSIKPNVYAGFICRMLKIPYCVNVQGLGTAFEKAGLAQMVTVLYKIALKHAKTVFFENQNDAAVFRDKKITPAKQQTILAGAGVNLEYYEYAPYPNNEEIHFLYLGRIMKEKGIDELFYAIRKLHEKYGNKVVLDIVGFFEDEYEEQIKQLEKEGIVKFYGFQKDPRPYYAMADCVVLPSYHEGMSNVLLEAASTGRPLITSDVSGCKEAVEDGKTGYLCKAQDKESVFEKMEAFMHLSSEQREEMGLLGRSKMRGEFDKEEVVKITKSAVIKEL